jgi:hypothetical protein
VKFRDLIERTAAVLLLFAASAASAKGGDGMAWSAS